jgi:hypothetical protein
MPCNKCSSGKICNDCYITKVKETCVKKCCTPNRCKDKKCKCKRKCKKNSSSSSSSSSSCSSSSSSSSDCSDNSCSDKCSKQKCNSCYSPCSCKCKCVKEYHCIKTKCGYYAMSLELTAAPAIYTTVGDVIVFTYRLTNTGTNRLCKQVKFTTNCMFLPAFYVVPYLDPGCSAEYTQNHTVTVRDLEKSVINVTACASTIIKCKCLVSCPSTTKITQGYTNVYGTMSQVHDVDTNIVTATVTFFNDASSVTPAINVGMALPIPSNVTNIVPGPGVSVMSSSIVFNAASIAVGASAVYTFTYTPTAVSPHNYVFSGTISSSTYNIAANLVVGSVITI